MLFLDAIDQLNDEEIRTYLRALEDTDRYYDTLLTYMKSKGGGAFDKVRTRLRTLTGTSRTSATDLPEQRWSKQTNESIRQWWQALATSSELFERLRSDHKEQPSWEDSDSAQLKKLLLEKLLTLANLKADLINDPKTLSRRLLGACADHYKIDSQCVSATAVEAQVAEAFLKEQQRVLMDVLAHEGEGAVDTVALAQHIDQVLDELAQGDREAIARAVGLERLTGESFIACFRAGGLTSAALAGLSATGMGAFLAMTTLIKALGLLVGITFPFAVYTGATTALGAATGPLGMVALPLAAVGIVSYRGRKPFRRALLAGTVASLHARLHDNAIATSASETEN